MVSCENCPGKYLECVDSDVDQWQCCDPVSWCDPETGNEVCRYWNGAVQRDSQPQNNVETVRTDSQQLKAEILPILYQAVGMLRDYKREDVIILLSKLTAKLSAVSQNVVNYVGKTDNVKRKKDDIKHTRKPNI